MLEEPEDRDSLESVLRFLMTQPSHKVLAGSYTFGDIVGDLAGMCCADGLCSCGEGPCRLTANED